ncbi:TIGR03089 family protein [Micromonospora pattaloongensis]|uniref:TIGR03089 family protein n=1 Tax=Micromonospora pattaloongensis TaxID=405436 RepID=A0A1H3M893_9ACTN|nr:TIGR03089 family protein [Micromonospora pattaloongensis]SDY72488.1 TIGR03089 family protein [Micromonospora pattaloongensis]
MAHNIARIFAAAVAQDPTRPLLTWYDDATGERTELSGATLANWVSKTANLLVDSAGVTAGDAVGVLLPPHWQTAAVLLGAWSAGLLVETEPARPVEVLFAAADRAEEATAWPAGERYLLSLAPMAAPLRDVPAGFADYVVEVRGHGDHFTPYTQGGPQDADLIARAARRGAELGLTGGARVLVDAARHANPLDWLLAPLAAGASIVLCGHADPARLPDRAAVEKVTLSLS